MSFFMFYVVCCPLAVKFMFRPLIGQHGSQNHFPGLSLIKALGFKIEFIHTTVFVWINSIFTPGAFELT